MTKNKSLNLQRTRTRERTTKGRYNCSHLFYLCCFERRRRKEVGGGGGGGMVDT